MKLESLMREQLPEDVYQLLRKMGETGDEMGWPTFVVGGIVRDLIIQRPDLDVDIVVEGDGIAFAHALAESLKGAVRRHRRFGTAAVALPGGFKVDVATARTETYAHPGALPSVEPGDIKEDLRRRDFTINAMAIKLNRDQFGRLVDFFDGRGDLSEGAVRILHNLSFQDDPTRIFRAIRFEQRYRFSIEPHTEKLLGKSVTDGYLARITGQRLRNEILLILKEEDPLPAIRRMAHFDLVKYIHPSICVSHGLVGLFDGVRRISEWWDSVLGHGRADAVLLNLMALLDQLDAAEVEDVSKRLALRKKHTDALRVSKTHLPDILRRMDGAEIPSSEIYRMLKGLPLEVLLFAIASSPETCDSIASYLLGLRKVRPLVNGNDLRELMYPEGPLYTQILDRTFAAQLDGLIADRREAIQFIKSRFPL
jgi:tRNA nucleotidyltransferase (CCA-adding enzyme)